MVSLGGEDCPRGLKGHGVANTSLRELSELSGLAPTGDERHNRIFDNFFYHLCNFIRWLRIVTRNVGICKAFDVASTVDFVEVVFVVSAAE